MALSPGTRLGHYDVTALLGEGGMGQVWQATDTQLNRQVALKILPDAFASDPDRLARFKREAQILASLNHPNIAAIYGIEESEGTRALVLELVEGPTLADRISKGPIPLDDALPIAKQIAEALEAAHEAGVIHRDLKPANIKVREDGMVKVLDFGLAKALDPNPDDDPSQSPTLTAAATRAGAIMGTAAYMAPEQAKGKVADKRADIWAFGVVLLEMLTGQRVFSGETISETLAAVMMKEPDWGRLSALPSGVVSLVRRCLEKDPRERVRDIGDVRLAMRGAFATTVSEGSSAPVTRLQVWQQPAPALVITLVLIGLTGFGVSLAMRSAPPRLTRLVVPTDGVAPFIALASPDVAISPDGEHIAYLTGNVRVGAERLHVRPLPQFTSETLMAQGELNSPFFSPDSQSVGFYDRSVTPPLLKRVSVLGGPASTICELATDLRGASWGPDGVIVFATGIGVSPTANPGAGLWRVAAVGGEPERLTTPDPEQGEVGHAWPEILPGGDAVLFTVVANPIEESEIAVLSLATGERKVIIRGGYYPKYSPTGHLLYGVEGNLWAVGFDPSRLEAVGDPVPVQEGVLTKGLWGTMDFGVAENGSLLYVSGVATDPQTADRTLVWVDRQGREEPIAMPPRPYYSARLSPDGTRVAVEVRDSNTDIWVHDFARATQTRLTFDPGLDRFPVWTPNGERIAFSSQRDGGILDIFWKPADGTGQPELVVSDPDRRLDAWSWTPDGQSLLINEGGPDIGIVTLGGDQARQPVLDEDFREGTPEVSPDGRWMAYRSDESGRKEIYVRPFPDVAGGKWQVSAEGGNYPAWSRDGRELFYRTLAGTDPPLMGVTVETEPTFSASVPQTVIEAGYVFASRQGRNWDISADGQRFLMLKESGATDDASAQRAQIILVQNWFEELNRLVPTN